MFCSTFHSHSKYDDGKGELRAYVEAALAKNMTCFGFSGHSPVNFPSSWNMKREDLPEYLREANALKKEFSDRIELYTGLETDFYEGCTDWRTFPGIDYTIGSVHFVKNKETNIYMPVDGNAQSFKETLDTVFDGEIQAFGEAYYQLIREMLMTMPPNIVGHLDVFRKNNAGNKWFDEEDEWYREEVMKTLDVISLTETIVEVNTGGISRGYVQEPYPSRWILDQCLDMEIPVMVNTDTHAPDSVDFYYEAAVGMLRAIGFKKQRVLLHNQWQDISL